MINIYLEFELKNETGMQLEGYMLVPYEDKAFYKPHTITILDGVLDFAHRNNTGPSGQKYRDAKDKIIQDKFYLKNGHAVLKEPFVYKEGQPTGATAFASIFLGMSTNRECSLKIINSLEYGGLKIAKLFQNAKGLKKSQYAQIQDINNLEKAIDLELRSLMYLYDQNIKTSSIDIKEVK